MANGNGNHQPPAPPALDQSAEILRQIAELRAKNADLEARLQTSTDFPTTNPVYEILEPGFYSSDDVYYPVGAQVEDLLGTMIPNECMVPMNAAARERSEAYIASLPEGRRTPNLGTIVETAMKMRPREGDDPNRMADFAGRLLAEAFRADYGADPSGGRSAPQMPVKRDGVPLMPNTRIGKGGSPQAPGSTRVARLPLPPGLKTTRAMGTVQSNPLGTEMSGVAV